MDWKTMLAYMTGSVDEELLRRNEYLAAENRILRAHIHGRVTLSDGERRTLAQIGKRLGRKALSRRSQALSGPRQSWPGTGGWSSRSLMAQRSEPIRGGPTWMQRLSS